MNKYIAILFFIGLSACTSQHSFKPLSSYKIDNDALKDGDTIGVLYSSGGPNDNRDKEYLYHLIVTTMDSKDTVNLLVPDISSLEQDRPVKTFISSTSAAYKMMLLSAEERKEVENVNSLKDQSIERVVSNREYAEFEQNHYPTVTGALGELLSSLPEDVQEIIEVQMAEAKAKSEQKAQDSL